MLTTSTTGSRPSRTRVRAAWRTGEALRPRAEITLELLELHTLGVDGGYTQQDVEEARCFTGWTVYKANEDGLFLFNPAEHDNGEASPRPGYLQRRPADGEMVLDILARHPSTAHFIAMKLARMLVATIRPSRSAAPHAYLRSDGSIAETLRSILISRVSRSALLPRQGQVAVEYAASAPCAPSARDRVAGMPRGSRGWVSRLRLAHSDTPPSRGNVVSPVRSNDQLRRGSPTTRSAVRDTEAASTRNQDAAVTTPGRSPQIGSPQFRDGKLSFRM